MFGWARRRRSYANVAATVALVIALGGSALAASGGGSLVGSDGTIHGCAPKNGGALKVVKPSKGCPKHAVAITWAQRGQPGSAGQNGAAGPTGPAGIAGAVGPTVGAGGGASNPPMPEGVYTKEITITTTTPGALYVTGNLTGSITNCNHVGGCMWNYGLYVDGNAVPGTEVQAGVPDTGGSGLGFTSISTSGVITGVAAGSHTVDLTNTSQVGTFGLFSQTGINVSAIELGS